MLVYSAMTEVWLMMVLITQYLLNAILYIKSPIKVQIVTKILKALFKVQKKREVCNNWLLKPLNRCRLILGYNGMLHKK